MKEQEWIHCPVCGNVCPRNLFLTLRITEYESITICIFSKPYIQSVDSRIYPYLQEMFDAAREDNIYPIVREGYRTTEEQGEIFNEKVQAYINEGYSKARAENTAKEWAAVPGTSEHQLGIKYCKANESISF